MLPIQSFAHVRYRIQVEGQGVVISLAKFMMRPTDEIVGHYRQIVIDKKMLIGLGTVSGNAYW